MNGSPPEVTTSSSSAGQPVPQQITSNEPVGYYPYQPFMLQFGRHNMRIDGGTVTQFQELKKMLRPMLSLNESDDFDIETADQFNPVRLETMDDLIAHQSEHQWSEKSGLLQLKFISRTAGQTSDSMDLSDNNSDFLAEPEDFPGSSLPVMQRNIPNRGEGLKFLTQAAKSFFNAAGIEQKSGKLTYKNLTVICAGQEETFTGIEASTFKELEKTLAIKFGLEPIADDLRLFAPGAILPLDNDRLIACLTKNSSTVFELREQSEELIVPIHPTHPVDTQPTRKPYPEYSMRVEWHPEQSNIPSSTLLWMVTRRSAADFSAYVDSTRTDLSVSKDFLISMDGEYVLDDKKFEECVQKYQANQSQFDFKRLTEFRYPTFSVKRPDGGIEYVEKGVVTSFAGLTKMLAQIPSAIQFTGVAIIEGKTINNFEAFQAYLASTEANNTSNTTTTNTTTSTITASHTIGASDFSLASATSRATGNSPPNFFTHENFTVSYASKTMIVSKGKVIDFDRFINNLERKFKSESVAEISGKLKLALPESTTALTREEFEQSQEKGINQYTFIHETNSNPASSTSNNSGGLTLNSPSTHPLSKTRLYSYSSFFVLSENSDAISISGDNVNSIDELKENIRNVFQQNEILLAPFEIASMDSPNEPISDMGFFEALQKSCPDPHSFHVILIDAPNTEHVASSATPSKKDEPVEFKYDSLVIKKLPYTEASRFEIPKGTSQGYSAFADMLRKQCGVSNNHVIVRQGKAAWNGAEFNTPVTKGKSSDYFFVLKEKFDFSFSAFEVKKANGTIIYIPETPNKHTIKNFEELIQFFDKYGLVENGEVVFGEEKISNFEAFYEYLESIKTNLKANPEISAAGGNTPHQNSPRKPTPNAAPISDTGHYSPPPDLSFLNY